MQYSHSSQDLLAAFTDIIFQVWRRSCLQPRSTQSYLDLCKQHHPKSLNGILKQNGPCKSAISFIQAIKSSTSETKKTPEPVTETNLRRTKTQNATDESIPSLSRKKEDSSKLEAKVYMYTARN